MSLHFRPLRVVALETEGEDALAVCLEPLPEDAELFRFEPGQYLTLRHGEQRRSYSICAAPGEPLRVGVRRVEGGLFSGWLHRHLRPGDWIDALPPQGRFGAALARRPHHVLAVAGGSGITPVLSLLRTLLRDQPCARATLVYGNRHAASTMFKDELEDLKNRHLARLSIHPVFSREQVESPLHAGRIDAARLATVLRLCGPVDECFVCGPHAMNDEVEGALRVLGLPGERIHVERFGVPPQGAAPAGPARQQGDASRARITIVSDGISREVPFEDADTSILAAAARAGLDVPYSCRSGVCATCRARLVEGQVRMERNFALEKADLDAGFVLACQAHPLTERVVLSFDLR